MHKAGAKGVEIAAELGHPKTTIYTIIKRFESRETVEGPKSTVVHENCWNVVVEL